MPANVPRLVTACYTEAPDFSAPEQRVAFGASEHRGSAFDRAFNEWHIFAIRGAICLWLAESPAIVSDSLAATPDRSDKS
jgi:phosphoglucomutase